jgi:hypothetical protein
MSLFTRDLIERVVRTFFAASLSVAVAGLAGVTDLDGLRGLAVAAGAAGTTAVLALITRRIGDPDTASVIDR